MNGSVSGAQLRAFIERTERLEEEKRTIADDIKEVKAEAKGCGYDLPTINAILKLRKKDAAERDEAQAMLDLYMSALGMLPLFEATGDIGIPITEQEQKVSYSEAKGRGDASHGEIPVLSTTPKASAYKASSAETGDLGTTPFDPETGELTDNQEQIGGNGPDLPVEASTDKQAAGASRPTNSHSAAHSPAERAGEAPSSSQASPATLSDMPISTTPSFAGRVTGDMPDIPDFLRRTEPKAREWEEA